MAKQTIDGRLSALEAREDATGNSLDELKKMLEMQNEKQDSLVSALWEVSNKLATVTERMGNFITTQEFRLKELETYLDRVDLKVSGWDIKKLLAVTGSIIVIMGSFLALIHWLPVTNIP